jgi:hypothetical protein
MTVTQDGTITGSTDDFVSEKPETVPVESATLRFANGPVMTRIDAGPATLSFAPQIKPLALVRVRSGEPVVMGGKGKKWPPEIQQLRSEISALVKEDQDARKPLDNERMVAADAKARPAVARILDKYGWVTKSLAGSDTADAFWLLVQHQDLDLQQSALA